VIYARVTQRLLGNAKTPREPSSHGGPARCLKADRNSSMTHVGQPYGQIQHARCSLRRAYDQVPQRRSPRLPHLRRGHTTSRLCAGTLLWQGNTPSSVGFGVTRLWCPPSAQSAGGTALASIQPKAENALKRRADDLGKLCVISNSIVRPGLRTVVICSYRELAALARSMHSYLRRCGSVRSSQRPVYCLRSSGACSPASRRRISSLHFSERFSTFQRKHQVAMPTAWARSA